MIKHIINLECIDSAQYKSTGKLIQQIINLKLIGSAYVKSISPWSCTWQIYSWFIQHITILYLSQSAPTNLYQHTTNL